MREYHKSILVQQEDLDELHHVNNVRYIQWIQDISRDHWLHVAGTDLQKSVAWVVRRHEVDYKNAAVLGDKIRLRTYIEGVKGPLSTRVVEMHLDGSGALLLRSRTTWCLLDARTLRPKRIPDEINRMFGL